MCVFVEGDRGWGGVDFRFSSVAEYCPLLANGSTLAVAAGSLFNGSKCIFFIA